MTKEEEIKLGFWELVIILPIVVGFSLVYANITVKIFNVIGWVLLIFGLLALAIYLMKLYNKHQEKVKKVKEDILRIFKKEKKEIN